MFSGTSIEEAGCFAFIWPVADFALNLGVIWYVMICNLAIPGHLLCSFTFLSQSLDIHVL